MGEICRQRCRAGDVGLDPVGRGCSLDDSANGLDGFVRQVLALVAGEIQLHIRRLAVRALHCLRGHRIPPEILDAQNVRSFLVELTHQIVVVPVCRFTEGLLADQDDHGHAITGWFVEYLTDVVARLHRRRILDAQRDGMFLCHLLQRWNGEVGTDRERQPGQNQDHRKSADHAGEETPAADPAPWLLRGAIGAVMCGRATHAPVTRQ